jgi:hypothetical protein
LSALGQVKTGIQLGHGRPDQPEHGFEVVAVQAVGGEFGGGGRADGQGMVGQRDRGAVFAKPIVAPIACARISAVRANLRDRRICVIGALGARSLDETRAPGTKTGRSVAVGIEIATRLM